MVCGAWRCPEGRGFLRLWPGAARSWASSNPSAAMCGECRRRAAAGSRPASRARRNERSGRTACGMGGVQPVDQRRLVGEAFSLGATQAADVHDVCDMAFEDLARAGHGFRRASTARLASSRLALGLLERNTDTAHSYARQCGSSSLLKLPRISFRRVS